MRITIAALVLFLSVAAAEKKSVRDDARAREAFNAVYPVLTHPRCVNCHPKGDAPLQGETSHEHTQNVKRGADGHGKFAMKCGACHQSKNLKGLSMPPGVPDWHLPEAKMPLVFEGKSAGELCRQMKDPHTNGGKSLAGVLDHLETPLVKWGWSPGEGRTTPEMSYADFVKNMRAWVAAGGACPD
jgi:hypothetical protein